MRKFLLCLVLFPNLAMASFDPVAGNPGFENTTTFSNWILTGIGTLTNSTANVRSGLRCAAINGLGTTYSTLHNTSLNVTVPASGTNYVTIVAWARRSTASANVKVAVDAGTALDVDGPAVPGGTVVNAAGGYVLVSHTFLAVNGTTYHPVLYAIENVTNGVAWDDVIIYTSSASALDEARPNAPNDFDLTVTGTNVQFDFAQGTDAGLNQSGIGGVLIVKSSATPLPNTAPVLNPQVYFSTDAAVGPTSIGAGFNVVYNGPALSSYTDILSTQGTYLFYMRDQAFNYTDGVSAARVFVINNTSPVTIVGPGTNVELDGLFVRSGNTLEIPAASTVTIRPLSNCQIHGEISALGNLNTQGNASRITFTNGSVFRWRNSAGLFANIATWNVGSTCWINNTTNGNLPATGLNQAFANFWWEMPLQATTGILPATFTLSGNFELRNSGTGTLALAGTNYTFSGNVQVDDDLVPAANSTFNFNGNAITQTISGIGTISPVLGTINVNTTAGGKVLQGRTLQVATAFNIASGAEFDAGSGGQVLQLSGSSNFTNNGTFTAGNGRVVFNGATAGAQSISTNIAQPFYQLEINRTAGELVVLNTAAAISHQLLLNGGLLVTNNSTLQLGASATTNAPAFGTNATSYVATCLASGAPATAGGLTIAGITAATRLYPVGNSFSSYSPANLVVSGATEDFTVRVAPGVAPGADIDFTSGLVWEVTETTAGGNQVQLNFQWNADDEGSLFSRTGCRIVKSDGTNILPLQKGNFGAAAGSNPYTKSSGTFLFTSFSPFSVSSEAILLPARFGSINARWLTTGAEIRWENNTESPGTRYRLERSADGRSFVAIGNIAGTATTVANTAYTYLDVAASRTEKQYYRLVALEGNQQFISQVVTLTSSAGSIGRQLQLVPNIITGSTLQLATIMPQATAVMLTLIDNSGKVLFNQKMVLPAGSANQSLAMGSYLPAGKYYLQLHSQEQQWQEVLPFVKQ